MLRIDNIRLQPGQSTDELLRRAAAILRTAPGTIENLTILRRSIDARDGVSLLYSVRVSAKHENQILKRCRSKQVSAYEKVKYHPPKNRKSAELRAGDITCHSIFCVGQSRIKSDACVDARGDVRFLEHLTILKLFLVIMLQGSRKELKW